MNPEQDTERHRNQKEFRELLEKYGITQEQAATLITEQSYKPIQGRAVRTWLASPDAVSARPCPTWAVMALKRATEHLTPIKGDAGK